MSAIAGLFHRDGQPPEPRILADMLGALRHRGPDGESCYLRDPMAFGRRPAGDMPLVSGELVLLADARLENRSELAACLSHGDPVRTDGELILAAYRRWGEACPAKLRGDFAFALWDERRRTLFCARDHFGVKPFYYYDDAGVFAFASEIKALFRVPAVRCRPCERAIGDYLADHPSDEHGTFYEDIRRLAPAHALSVGPGGLRRIRYWSLDPSPELSREAKQTPFEAFRQAFFAAVRRRIGDRRPLGILLSGGLDSSSVACVARELLEGETCLTFSAVFDGAPDCDERTWARTVLAGGGLLPHWVRSDGPDALAGLERMLWHQEEPFCSPTFFIHWALCAAARRAGVGVLLDGFHGDTTVSHGLGHLAEIAGRGRWEQFASEALAVSGHLDQPADRFLQRYGLPALAEMARSRPALLFAGQAAEAFRPFGLSPWPFVLRQLAERWMPPPLVQALRSRPWKGREALALLRPAFARRSGLVERLKQARFLAGRPARSAREEHHRAFIEGNSVYLEAIDKSCGAFSLPILHPFLDLELVELCVAFPGDLKLRGGWTRYVVREGLGDLLPPAVRWRGGKTNLLGAFRRVFLPWLGDFPQGSRAEILDLVSGYVDPSALGRAWDRAGSATPLGELLVFWRALCLGLWLRLHALAEPVS